MKRSGSPKNSEATVAKEDNLTPFQPGQSGNPKGRPKGSRNLSAILKDMLDQDVEEDGQLVKFSDAIVKRLIQKANKGDIKAIQEIFDRTEGKAKQEIKNENFNYNSSELSKEDIKNISEALDNEV